MEEKKFTLFGTDLQKIPCFKKTFTVSIYSGLAAGLGCFLITSRIKKSADVAVLSFAATTLGYCAADNGVKTQNHDLLQTSME